MERIAKNKLEVLSRPPVAHHPYLATLMQMDRSPRACTILTQHLMAVALYAYTPQHRHYFEMPDIYGRLRNCKHELIANAEESLNFE